MRGRLAARARPGSPPARDAPAADPRSFFGDRLKPSSNFTQWAADTYAAGSGVVYSGIEPDSSLPKSYIAKSREVARQQVAIGGYRLAQYLNNALA